MGQCVLISKYFYQFLHGIFQRENECFDVLICKQLPGNLYISLLDLTFALHSGLYIAVCDFQRPAGYCEASWGRTWSLHREILLCQGPPMYSEGFPYELLWKKKDKPSHRKKQIMQLKKSPAVGMADFGFAAHCFYSWRFT